ncbi:hypothetical protein A7K94_0204570 [Modestobacter sp. VKM Ac-2676]|nr:hypothetical protein A7K94_0204570 [Modestobacter sp. VKM Ac-2676]
MEQTPTGTVLTEADDALRHEATVLVAGQRLDSDFQDVVNPARLHEVVGRVALGTAEHVDRAVTAAAAAFPAWSRLTAHERAARLGAAAARSPPPPDRSPSCSPASRARCCGSPASTSAAPRTSSGTTPAWPTTWPRTGCSAPTPAAPSGPAAARWVSPG